MDSENNLGNRNSGNMLQQEISYRKLVQIVMSRWHWLVFSIAFALLVAWGMLTYTGPTYATKASLKFEEKRSEMAELISVRNVYDRSDRLLSEQYVIRSRAVLSNAIYQLHYPISFYKKETINEKELYPLIPLDIIVLQPGTNNSNLGMIKFSPEPGDTFTLQYTVDEEAFNGTYQFGQIITIKDLRFKIQASQKMNENDGPIFFHFNSMEELLSRVDKGLKMNENKNTNILTFIQIDANYTFARDILNAIVSEYLAYDQLQKTISATQTINFITRLQSELVPVVKTSASNFEAFKVNAQMLDATSNTKQLTDKLNGLEKEQTNNKLAAVMISQLDKDITSNQNPNSINYNVQGANDPVLSGLLGQYNLLYDKKQLLSLTYKPSSTSIAVLDEQILQTKSSILANVRSQRNKNKKAADFLHHEISGLGSSFTHIPRAEKNYVNLQSEYQVNQKVYAYLSEKKLEAQISRSAVTAGATIIDRAPLMADPIYPIPQKTFTAAVVLGVILGIGSIFSARLLNPYIQDRQIIEQLTTVPLIGVILKYTTELSSSILETVDYRIHEHNSVFSESVRAVRTNVSYLAPEKHCKVICISSETAQEGKSFTAIHLASTLCLIEKKVIIIGADLRKSKLHRTFAINNDLGLSNHLLLGLAAASVIFPTEINNLDFIPAGPTPSNPSELLHSARMSALIDKLKLQYDYIIIDCAPIGIVSDALPIIKLADINLFIIRAKFSRQSAALIPEQLSRKYMLSNFSIILNAYENDVLHSRYYKGENTKNSYYQPEQGYNEDYLMEVVKKEKWKFWKS
jgi:tyrosine-protein kinase Etk/Wzc